MLVYNRIIPLYPYHKLWKAVSVSHVVDARHVTNYASQVLVSKCCAEYYDEFRYSKINQLLNQSVNGAKSARFL